VLMRRNISAKADTSTTLNNGRAKKSAMADKVPMMSSGWKERLSAAIRDSGKSQRAVAMSAGKASGYLTGILREGKEPGVAGLQAICDAIPVSLTWVLHGTDDVATLPALPPSDDQALIPVFDIQASAGPGLIAPDHEMIAESVSLPVTYLRHITTTHPRHLCLIGVKGDSMLPTLKQDDLVMLDTTKTSLGYDGLFVLEMDGALHVKRVTRGSQTGVVRIISDNAAHYPTYERAAHEIQVKGKVVWKGVKE
jgi:transcriptional regulator with XRE-family HTH domain